MTVALLAAGALSCLVGTRAAVVVFGAAAATAALSLSGPLEAVAVWTALTAAGLVLAGAPVRRLALPAAGAAAVVLAAGTNNAALVLPAWTLGTAAAIASASTGGPQRRWAFALLLADLPVVVAVAVAATADGFVPWPRALDPTAAALLGLGAALRLPLCGGPLDRAPEPGLLVVRTQTLVLVMTAIATPGAGRTAVVAGAVTVAVGGFVVRAGVRDAAWEAGLFAVAVGGVALGWATGAFLWGALAAGSFLHVLRVGGRGTAASARSVWEILRSGGFGSLWLPAAAGLGAAAARAGGISGAVVLGALVAGLAGRFVTVGARDAPRVRWSMPSAAAMGLLAAGLAMALWAPAMMAGRSGPGWPPGWALIGPVAGAAAGGRWARVTAPSRIRRPKGPALQPGVPLPLTRVLDASEATGALAGTLGVLAATAAGVWLIALARGFI